MAELTQAENADLARATERYSESGRRTEELLHRSSTYTEVRAAYDEAEAAQEDWRRVVSGILNRLRGGD